MRHQKTVAVTLVKRKYGRKPGHRECVEGLGLRRLHQRVLVQCTPENLGMVKKISYLLKIEDNIDASQ